MTCDPDDWRKERQEAADVAEAILKDSLVDAAKAVRAAQDAVHRSGPVYYPNERKAGLEAAAALGDTVHDHVLVASLLRLVQSAD
jgi:hypothetical protein